MRARPEICRGCGAPITWKLTVKQKWTPVNPLDESPHWATCPKAKDFKRKPSNIGRNKNT
jgi:hypothetical protein